MEAFTTAAAVLALMLALRPGQQLVSQADQSLVLPPAQRVVPRELG